MNLVRDNLLAGTIGSHDEYAGIRGRDLSNHGPHHVKRFGLPNHGEPLIHFFAETHVFLEQFFTVQGLANRGQ